MLLRREWIYWQQLGNVCPTRKTLDKKYLSGELAKTFFDIINTYSSTFNGFDNSATTNSYGCSDIIEWYHDRIWWTVNILLGHHHQRPLNICHSSHLFISLAWLELIFFRLWVSNTGFSFLQHFHIESFFLKEKCQYWYQKLELFTQISTRWYFNLFSPNIFYRLFLISVFAFFLVNIFSAVQSQFYFLLWSCSNIFTTDINQPYKTRRYILFFRFSLKNISDSCLFLIFALLSRQHLLCRAISNLLSVLK